jgi:hypothetical protein
VTQEQPQLQERAQQVQRQQEPQQVLELVPQVQPQQELVVAWLQQVQILKHR